jgi:hypothetical protein
MFVLISIDSNSFTQLNLPMYVHKCGMFCAGFIHPALSPASPHRGYNLENDDSSRDRLINVLMLGNNQV